MPTPDYDAARDEYDPRRIGLRVKLLWVAESRPASGAYFYISPTTGKDSLFRETMKALGWWPVDEPMPARTEKERYLTCFQKCGYLLEDIVQRPVNKGLSRSQRTQAIQDGVQPLLGKLREIDPEHIIIIKGPVYEELTPALLKSRFGSRLLNQGPIPFPGSNHAIEYRNAIVSLLDRVPPCE